jgi:prepilin-type N-terminal cleavage/methylation domain-containing protein
MMRGVTLMETMIALLVLGLLSGLAAAAIVSIRPAVAEPWMARVTRDRDSAIRTGRPVVSGADTGYRAFFLPDGRAIGPGLDVLTGEIRP